MVSVKKGDVLHTSINQRAKDIETCKMVYVPMESAIEIVKKEKIQTGYLFTARYNGHTVEIPSVKCFSPSEWDKYSKLAEKLKGE